MSEKRKTRPKDRTESILPRYQDQFRGDPTLPVKLKRAEDAILATRPDIVIDTNFLYYIFNKPEIAWRFAQSTIGLIESLNKEKKAERSTFVIDEENGKIHATRNASLSEVAKVIEENKINGPRISDERQSLAYISSFLLRGAVGSGVGKGDLQVFASIRERREEEDQQGVNHSNAKNPLLIIKETDIKGMDKMLFIQEGDALSKLSSAEYRKHLEDAPRVFEGVKHDSDSVKALESLGFKSSVIHVPYFYYKSRFPFVQQGIYQVAFDLGLAA